MKILIYWDGKDLRELVYNVKLLKNLKKEIYVFLNGYTNIDKVKNLKRKLDITFIVAKTRVSKIKAIKVIKNKIKDDILFVEGRINFNIKALKRLPYEGFIRFGYKSKFLKLLRLNGINRVFYFTKEISTKDLIELYLGKIQPEVEVEYILEKSFFIDIVNNLKRILKKPIRFLRSILRRKAVKDLINQKIGALSLRVFTFLLAIFLSRYFSPEYYGRYINFHSLSVGIYTFISLLIPNIAFKFFSKDSREFSEYFTSFLTIYLILSIVAFFVLLLFKGFILKVFFTRNLLIIPLIVATAFLIAIRSTVASVFIANLKFNMIKYFDILEGLLKFSLVVLLSLILFSKGSILGLFLCFLSVSIIELIVLKKRYPNILKFKLNKDKIKEVIKNALSINYGNIFYTFYNPIRLSIISYLLGASSLAFYYNAFNLAIIAANLSSVYPVFLPRIARWEEKKLKENLRYLLLLQGIIYLPIILILLIFSRQILVILFGNIYASSSTLLRIFTILFIANALSIYTSTLWIKSKLKEVSIINLASTISLIVLDFLLIRRYLLIGATISLIFSYLIGGILGYVFYKKVYS